MEYNKLIYTLNKVANETTDNNTKSWLNEIVWDLSKNGVTDEEENEGEE